MADWRIRPTIHRDPTEVVYKPNLRRWLVYAWTHELWDAESGAYVPLHRISTSSHRFRFMAVRACRRWLAARTEDDWLGFRPECPLVDKEKIDG